MKRKEYFGDRLYKDLSYIFDYYGIYHHRRQKGPEIWLEYYGGLLHQSHSSVGFLCVERDYKLCVNDDPLYKWVQYYVLTLIREGICPLNIHNSKALSMSGPCEMYLFREGKDSKRAEDMLRRGHGRALSEYSYGTNTNTDWRFFHVDITSSY